VGLHSFLTDVASESFYKQFESLCDAIIDFQSRQIGDSIEHRVRASAVRGRPYDPRWRRLKSLDKGEVTLADQFVFFQCAGIGMKCVCAHQYRPPPPPPRLIIG